MASTKTNPLAPRVDRWTAVSAAMARTLIVLPLLLAVGCYRPPQVAPDNIELITSLRTAISTRNLKRLDDNVLVIGKRHAAGELSDTELAAFNELIEMARAGQWEAAEKRVVKFQGRQRPTQEQIDRLPKPKPRPAG